MKTPEQKLREEIEYLEDDIDGLERQIDRLESQKWQKEEKLKALKNDLEAIESVKSPEEIEAEKEFERQQRLLKLKMGESILANIADFWSR